MTKKEDKLIGEYIREERLGRGSFASVYKGRHKVTNKIVAIKDIYIEKMPEKHLQAEIDIMRDMSHPCIVKLIDCIRTKRHVYLIMEYCSLGDMNTFLKSTCQNKGMSEQDLIHFLDQMASALKYLEQRNFIHRDIKPQNILLVPSNNNDGSSLPNIKISDFGFAKFLPSTDLTNSYCGSPLYMAPEIIARKGYDSKADLWSLGVLLYEMMMGKKMIETNHMYELEEFLHGYHHQQLDFTTGHYQFSLELTNLISILLKKNPKERASCEEFFHRVQLIKTREQDDYVVILTDTHTPPPEITTTAIRRHRKFSVGSAGSVLTKAFSKASIKLFGNNLLPPLPPTPPLIDSQTFIVEDFNLDKLIITDIHIDDDTSNDDGTCKGNSNATFSSDVVSCNSDTITHTDKDNHLHTHTHPDNATQVKKITEIITAVEFYAGQKWTTTDCLLTTEEAKALSFKVASLIQYAIKKQRNYIDQNQMNWLNQRYKDNIQQCGAHFKTDLSVEKLLYDKALELSRAAAVKQLIHEELNCCIFQYQQAILILEAIIIDDTQNISNGDQAIIKTLIQSIQSRLDKAIIHL